MTPPQPPEPPGPARRPKDFILPTRATPRRKRTRLRPTQRGVTGNCRSIDPAGRQCQLPSEHRGVHRVRYPGSRGPFVYTWGDESEEEA